MKYKIYLPATCENALFIHSKFVVQVLFLRPLKVFKYDTVSVSFKPHFASWHDLNKNL